MRKEVNGEKFIQGKDLIFIVDNSILENNYVENNNETEKIYSDKEFFYEEILWTPTILRFSN